MSADRAAHIEALLASAPITALCWKPQPRTAARCDRRSGHPGFCSWDFDRQIALARIRESDGSPESIDGPSGRYIRE